MVREDTNQRGCTDMNRSIPPTGNDFERPEEDFWFDGHKTFFEDLQ